MEKIKTNKGGETAETMIEIKNKVDSVKYIYILGLNTLAEKVFTNPGEEDLIRFMDENHAKYYILRDKKNSSGKRYLHITRDEVLEHYKEYDFFL